MSAARGLRNSAGEELGQWQSLGFRRGAAYWRRASRHGEKREGVEAYLRDMEAGAGVQIGHAEWAKWEQAYSVVGIVGRGDCGRWGDDLTSGVPLSVSERNRAGFWLARALAGSWPGWLAQIFSYFFLFSFSVSIFFVNSCHLEFEFSLNNKPALNSYLNFMTVSTFCLGILVKYFLHLCFPF